MNQTQRTFLINKIKETTTKRVEELKKQIPQHPSLTNYLFSAVMKDDFELQSTESLRELIKAKALNSKEGSNWLNEDTMGWQKERTIRLGISELFVIPDDYTKVYNEYKEQKEKIEAEINAIKLQSDTLITRIQLASDKVLQTMINEVDDMGNISLMDTKIKSLTA